jgi:TetR/AcrR family transcriptional regulator, tetracycline repressor protein
VSNITERCTVLKVNEARGPGQRAGLTRAAVLVAAREVLAEGGVEAMTMRALARRLDVAPNTLYSHVANKTALLDDLLDELLAEVPAPAADPHDPIAALVDLMTATYAVLTAHSNLVPLYLARQGARGPHAVRLGAVMDALLTRAGVSPVNATEARRVLIVHTIGFAAFAGAPTEPDTRPLSFASSQRTFDRSLRWLLAGITQSAGDDRGPKQQ